MTRDVLFLCTETIQEVEIKAGAVYRLLDGAPIAQLIDGEVIGPEWPDPVLRRELTRVRVEQPRAKPVSAVLAGDWLYVRGRARWCLADGELVPHYETTRPGQDYSQARIRRV